MEVTEPGTSNLIMSSKSVARCIVCKRELDFEVDELDRIIDDNIWYCDECLEIAAYGSFAFWDNPIDAEYDNVK